MSSAKPSLSNASQVFSIYRSLLREATYLPDEAAQSYFHRWISHRFHTAASKREPDPEGLRKARRALYRLQRANNGQRDAMQWVLHNTYGRIGKRRRELLENLRAHGDEHLFPKDDSEVKKLLENPQEAKPKEKAGLLAMKTKLQTLIKSMRQISLDDSPRSDIKKIAAIPELNSWQRPLPLKLRANMERRRSGKILDKVLPPLPHHEHERLHNLATGILPFPGIPQRRSSKPQPSTDELISEKEIARLLYPIEHVEKKPVEESHDNHKITPRYMQRHWMHIWKLCPVMRQNEQTNQWKVTWPSLRSLPVASVVTTASLSDLELFEGTSGDFKVQKMTPRFKRQMKRKHIAMDTI